jgi:hypothetical protein
MFQAAAADSVRRLPVAAAMLEAAAEGITK